MRKVPLGSSLPWALALLVAALGLTAGRSHFQAPSEVLGDFRLNLFQGHQGRRLADAFAALPADSTVVADWDQATVLWYAQYVDGTNRSVRISFPTSTLPTVLQRSEGPVYLATAAARPSDEQPEYARPVCPGAVADEHGAASGPGHRTLRL